MEKLPKEILVKILTNVYDFSQIEDELFYKIYKACREEFVLRTDKNNYNNENTENNGNSDKNIKKVVIATCHRGGLRFTKIPESIKTLSK